MYGFFQGTPVTVHSLTTVAALPRWLQPMPDLVRRIRRVENYDSLWDFCVRQQPRRVCLYRTYALGDILMLLPVARAMHRRLSLPEPMTIVVERRFTAQLKWHACEELWFVPARGVADYGADVHFNLNGALEADHRGGEPSNRHRLELYGRALGIEVVNAES